MLVVINRRCAGIWAVAAVTSTAVSASGLGTPQDGSRLSFSLIESTLFGLMYLGVPLSTAMLGDRSWTAVGATVLNLSLCVVNGIMIWRLNRWYPPTRVVWMGLALFTMGAAASTALGRAETSEAALSSRYQGISPLWWVVDIVIAAMAVTLVIQQRVRPGAVAALTALRFCGCQSRGTRDWYSRCGGDDRRVGWPCSPVDVAVLAV